MNVICLCFDTLRADIIGPGQKLSHIRTPNFDAFEDEAVTFTRAFGEGQPTLQTRRSLFTGRRSFPWRFNFDRRGVWHNGPGWHKIPPHHDTLSEILVDHGYCTGLVADVYHMFKPTMNFTRGFCSWEFVRGQESDNYRSGPESAVEEQLKQWVRQPITWNRHRTLVQYAHNMQDRRSEDDYLCAKVAAGAERWLEDNRDNGPFFLWVDFFDPHEPWDPPKRFADEYFASDGLDFVMPGAAGPEMTADECRRIKALYSGEVTFVDQCFGRVREAIERLGLLDDTIIVMLSDHGTQLHDHGQFGKGLTTLRAYDTRLNLRVRHPDGPRGTKVDAFVQAHDLAPTVCHWLDVDYARHTGEDFWPTVDGATLRDEVLIGWSAFGQGRSGGRVSARCDRWNYVVVVDGEEQGPELYDLQADPDEDHNVIDAHPEVAADKKKRVEGLLGQPIPARLEEITNRDAPPPQALLARARQRQ